MYLTPTLLALSFVFAVGASDCGCQLNRDQCDEKPSHKYSEEANEPHDNKAGAFDTSNMVFIKGDTFEMGTSEPHFPTDLEGPLRNVTVDPFYLDKYEVSNQNFLQFVRATGYKTEAEEFGDSFIFEMQMPEEEREKHEDFRAVQAPWWIKMKGVAWASPEGPGSSIEGNNLTLCLKVDTQIS